MFFSSWSVGSSNLPAPSDLASGLQTGDSYYITTSGTDNADGGGNTEAFGGVRGSTFVFDDIPPVTGVSSPLDFTKELGGFDESDVQRIMHDNCEELLGSPA